MGPQPRPTRILAARKGDVPQGPRPRGAGAMAPPVLEGGGCGRRANSRLTPRSSTPAQPAAERKRSRRATCASARSFHLETGLRRSRGRARGLCWLQKSTSSAWSGRKVMGLAPWLHTFARAAAQGVKARWKPGRGGESHEHASSDTGGGLLEIPRVLRESAACDRGREHSAMEGVLVRRKPPSLTRRRKKAGLATRSDGDAA